MKDGKNLRICIDISPKNGIPNFENVKLWGVEAVLLYAIDPEWFDICYARAKRNGLMVGAYCDRDSDLSVLAHKEFDMPVFASNRDLFSDIKKFGCRSGLYYADNKKPSNRKIKSWIWRDNTSVIDTPCDLWRYGEIFLAGINGKVGVSAIMKG